jgi:hypothetical protein
MMWKFCFLVVLKNFGAKLFVFVSRVLLMTLASAPSRGSPMSPLGNMASDVQIKTFLCARFSRTVLFFPKEKEPFNNFGRYMRNCSSFM